MKARFSALALGLLLAAAVSIQGQEGFGFGFDEEESGGTADGSGIGSLITGAAINGKAQGELIFYAEEFESAEAFRGIRPGNIFSGELNFSASASNADGVINLNLRPDFNDPSRILSLNEAYVRAFFGKLTVEGGLRKLTWGKADSLGPLDVINPLDYSDLSAMSDIQSIKIARPLIRASYDIGAFAKIEGVKIEGVFVPWFEGHRFAQSPDDRWASSQVADFQNKISARFGSQFALLPTLGINDPPPSIDPAQVSIDTSTLEYAQGGLRLTATAGSSDIGVQYYSGFLPRPAFALNEQGISNLSGTITAKAIELASITGKGDSMTSTEVLKAQEIRDSIRQILASLNPLDVVDIVYTRYHQIGVDYAQVLWGFNFRGEFAANITEDLKGDDGLVYNPSLAWSLGFDRDIFAGINVNLQVNENIRLLDSKTGSGSILHPDIEADSDITSTRLTLVLSKKFLRDELELRATGIWGIEDMDCYIIPALIWTKGDVALELSGGIFAGDEKGELGQYRNNGFIKTALTYSF
ncbi:MAG: hypothetical protein LBE17_11210 [Treponema sp.]|jgi:hypothetical protein|nr:hypothetical protein [Treponema sp.]